MTVRDVVPAEIAMPRFLAPGDSASATLLIDNVEGAPGAYRVSISGEGPIAANATKTYELAKGAKATDRFEFSAAEAGIGALTLSVEGPAGFKVARSYPIQSRTPYYPVTQTATTSLPPGATFTADAKLLDPFVPGTGEVSVSFSRLKGVEPRALLDSLYRYPYGCTEQLTSSAMPLLFIDALGGEVGKGPERAVRPRVQTAINEILNRQSADGAFGLWREGDGWGSPWLGAYVTDFLHRAKAAGYAVPDEALDRSYQALSQIARIDRWTAVAYDMRANTGVGSNDTNDLLRRRAAAYALYVLARAGRADLSDLRYFHDALLAGTPDALSRGHIGAALATMGDRARANNAFTKATESFGYQNTGDYYQTPLRDVSGILALAAETDRVALVDQISDEFARRMRAPNELHTQEKAFVLLAAQALLKRAGPVALSMNGTKLAAAGPAPSFAPDAGELAKTVSWRNDGDGPVFRTVTVSGSPKAAPPAAAQGFTIDKRILTRAGAPADLSAIRQNDRVIVAITGKAEAERLHPAVIADLLPAGFEIEAALTPEDAAQAEGSGPYGFLGELTRPQVAEARDDRFVAAFNVRSERFTFAYVARAVTPGTYVMPGVVVEDMYRPGVVGRSASGRLTILPSQ
jgi:uncharacterized protein YfaS (alpha-2-macroglobulin family)